MDFSPLTDGRDHINIYSKGRTVLGRLLTNLSPLRFELDGEEFNSMENYWFYTKANMLGCDGRLFLPLTPFDAKKAGKSLPEKEIDFDAFKGKMIEGMKWYTCHNITGNASSMMRSGSYAESVGR